VTSEQGHVVQSSPMRVTQWPAIPTSSDRKLLGPIAARGGVGVYRRVRPTLVSRIVWTLKPGTENEWRPIGYVDIERVSGKADDPPANDWSVRVVIDRQADGPYLDVRLIAWATQVAMRDLGATSVQVEGVCPVGVMRWLSDSLGFDSRQKLDRETWKKSFSTEPGDQSRRRARDHRQVLDEGLRRAPWDAPDAVVRWVVDALVPPPSVRSAEDPALATDTQYKRVRVQRSFVFGWGGRLVLAEALREAVENPDVLLETYVESVIRRRLVYLDAGGDPMFRLPTAADGLQPLMSRASPARVRASLEDGREVVPPERFEWWTSERPAMDGRAAWAGQRVVDSRRGGTHGGKYWSGTVHMSPLGSPRDDMMRAAVNSLVRARSKVFDDPVSSTWLSQQRAAQEAWIPAAGETGRLARQGTPTPTPQRPDDIDYSLWAGEPIDGVSKDNSDTAFHLLAIWPRAFRNGVDDARSRGQDVPEQWTVEQLVGEFLRNIDTMEIMAMIGVHAFNDLMGNPKIETPITADALAVTFENGISIARWRDRRISEAPRVIGGCPGAKPLSVVEFPWISKVIDRLDSLIPGSWASGAIDIDARRTDPRLAFSSVRMSLTFCSLFAPLAWSLDPAAHELTGKNWVDILQADNLLTHFSRENGHRWGVRLPSMTST
jgi:hypothetical protein